MDDDFLRWRRLLVLDLCGLLVVRDHFAKEIDVAEKNKDWGCKKNILAKVRSEDYT